MNGFIHEDIETAYFRARQAGLRPIGFVLKPATMKAFKDEYKRFRESIEWGTDIWGRPLRILPPEPDPFPDHPKIYGFRDLPITEGIVDGVVVSMEAP